MTITTALIDGDILAYKFGFSVEEGIDWGDGEFEFYADMDQCTTLIDAFIADTMSILKADEYVVCVSDDSNFRLSLAPYYKGNRKDIRRPLLVKAVKEYFLKHAEYRCYMRPNLEGDDVLGIIASSEAIIPGNKIVVSMDKDSETVPCYWYNPRKPDLGVQEITEERANYAHMYQTLVGDTIDNYPGCPGVGPVKAGKILADPKLYWYDVVEAYLKRGKTEEDALLQARLARILRASDYDFTLKQPILWKPAKTHAELSKEILN